MPRLLRIQHNNAWHHVMNRGANRQLIFKTEDHKRIFLSLLGDITHRFSIEIHAYCLMSNHYHLLICTPLGNLARAIRHLNGLYTQRFNRIEKRDGPLFRGRYKAILIDADSYLLQVSRYIHLNPVDARLCQLPHKYGWSSYGAYVGLSKSPSWLQKEFTLTQFGKIKQRERYAQFVDEGIDNEVRKFYSKIHLAPILGTPSFIDKHLNKVDEQIALACAPDIKRAKYLPTLDIIIEKTANFFHVSKQSLKESTRGQTNLARLVGVYLAKNIGQFSHVEIAKTFKDISAGGVGAAVKRCEVLVRKMPNLKRKLDALIEVLMKECIK